MLVGGGGCCLGRREGGIVAEGVFVFQAIGDGLAVKFGARAEEKVERIALLRGLQTDIAAEAHHYAGGTGEHCDSADWAGSKVSGVHSGIGTLQM